MRLELPVLLSPRLGQIVRIVIDADAPGDFAADHKTNGVAKFSKRLPEIRDECAASEFLVSQAERTTVVDAHARRCQCVVETQRMTPDAE
jgi:hypothetical protein